MSTVYILKEFFGDYEDAECINIAAYADKDKAEAAKLEAEAKLAKLCALAEKFNPLLRNLHREVTLVNSKKLIEDANKLAELHNGNRRAKDFTVAYNALVLTNDEVRIQNQSAVMVANGISDEDLAFFNNLSPGFVAAYWPEGDKDYEVEELQLL